MELAQQKQSSACVLKYFSFCRARFIRFFPLFLLLERTRQLIATNCFVN